MVIVDTCSLINLSRYYLPFDEEGKLNKFFEKKFRNREIVMLDIILNECKQVSKGLVVQSMPFWESDEKLIVKTNDLTVPTPRKFSNQLDNNFCYQIARNQLSNEAYATQRQSFLDSGDGKIILYALNKSSESHLFEKIVVLTDESNIPNDGKLFKKLPAICEFLEIQTMTLVDYLKKHNIEVDWNVPEETN